MPGYQGFALYLALMVLVWMARRRGFLEVFAGLAFLTAYLSFTNRWIAVAALVAPVLALYYKKLDPARNKLTVFLVLIVYYWLVACAVGMHFDLSF